MNPELESFAANLRSVPAPKSNVDRDQLMYDAGWAAALAHQEPKVKTRSRGLSSLAMSFVGGVAVAAAVLLSVMPLFDNGISNDSGTEVAVQTTEESDKTIEPSQSSIASLEIPDLIEWLESIPPGHSIRSSITSTPATPALSITNADNQPAINQRPSRPKNSAQLFQELLPDSVARSKPPTWMTWLAP